MKNFAIRLLPALAAALLPAACDNVEESERYIELEKAEIARNVLLEEFTGQRCVNCPRAHETISLLKEQYGDALISVSIHAGNFGIAPGQLPDITGLMQPEGDEYASHWSISAYPAAVVNRSGNAINNTELWSGTLRQEVAKAPLLALAAEAAIEGDSIVVVTTAMPDADIEAKLQLWVTESGISAFQLDSDIPVYDYTHNHVFRAAVNGTWGEEATLTQNIHSTTRHAIALRDEWQRDKLSVVAFVYNDKEGVLQATECEVKCGEWE